MHLSCSHEKHFILHFLINDFYSIFIHLKSIFNNSYQVEIKFIAYKVLQCDFSRENRPEEMNYR